MPLRPEDISTDGLARNALGGYKARPTEEMLKRVAWEYRKLLEDSRVLGETGEQLRRRVAELEARLVELEGQAQNGREADEAHQRARSLEAEAQHRLQAAFEAQRVGAQVRSRIRAALEAILAEEDTSPPEHDERPPAAG